jgi:hypothetical protein
MKRSDLLAKIQEYLDHNEHYEYCNSAESILEIIEEAGMLPPFVGEKIKKPCKMFLSALTEDAIYSGECFWEKE